MEVMSEGTGLPLETKENFLENNFYHNKIFSSKSREISYHSSEEDIGEVFSSSLIIQSTNRSDECGLTDFEVTVPLGGKKCFAEREISFENNMTVITTGDGGKSPGSFKDCEQDLVNDKICQIKSAVLNVQNNTEKNAKETFDVHSYDQTFYHNSEIDNQNINSIEEHCGKFFQDGFNSEADESEEEEEDEESDDEFTPIFNNKSGSPLTLGSGQFGTVIALRNLATYQKVAMKEIKCRDDKEREDALREVKIHQQLQHENIIKFINHCEINNTIQILMETVSSGSMAKCLLVWGCLEEKVVAHHLRQILCAIKHMHDRGIVHLDIKGDNILVNEETACCKLSDFGCAHILKEAHLNRPLGTINFMAPEVIVSSTETSSTEAKTYGKPADVWSTGCTAIEMANGKRPYYEYDSKSIISILYKVGTKKSHPPFPLNASRKFVDFLERCFCPEPLDRGTVSELLRHPFILRGKEIVEKLKDEPVENVCEAMIEEERQGEEELIQNDNPSIEKSPLAASPPNQSSLESRQLQASSFCTDNIIPSTVFHTEVALPRNDVNSGLCYHPYTRMASLTEDFNSIDVGKKDNKIKNRRQQETMWTDDNKEYSSSHQEELSFDENESLLLWLQNIGVPMSEIHKFCIHQCNLHDVLYNLQFDDLKDMEISVGPRARIWNAMQEHRHKQQPRHQTLPGRSSWGMMREIMGRALVFGLELSKNC